MRGNTKYLQLGINYIYRLHHQIYWSLNVKTYAISRWEWLVRNSVRSADFCGLLCSSRTAFLNAGLWNHVAAKINKYCIFFNVTTISVVYMFAWHCNWISWFLINDHPTYVQTSWSDIVLYEVNLNLNRFWYWGMDQSVTKLHIAYICSQKHVNIIIVIIPLSILPLGLS